MPPKISFVSGKKGKAENDLTKTTQPSSSQPPKPYVPPIFGISKPYTPPVLGSTKPYTPPIFGSSPASSQDSSKRLRPSYSPSPASNSTAAPNIVPNPFRRNSAAPTTFHTPLKQSLFSKKSQTSAQSIGNGPSASNGTNVAPSSSQFSTTLGPTSSQGSVHTPPKVSLFNKKKPIGISRTDGQNSTPSSSQTSNSSHTLSQHPSSQESRQNGNRFPNPFRKATTPRQESFAAPTSSPKTGIKLRLNYNAHGSASITTSSPSSFQSNINLSAHDSIDLAALLEDFLGEDSNESMAFIPPSFLKPDTSPRTPRTNGCHSSSTPSTDRTISGHFPLPTWSAFSLTAAEQEYANAYLSSPEPEHIILQKDWTPPPALVSALRASDDQELAECKEKVALVKMQLNWATMGDCDPEELKGLRRGIEMLEICGRNLERKLGFRDGEEEEWVESVKKDEETDIESFVRAKQRETVGVMPQRLHRDPLHPYPESGKKHVNFANNSSRLGKMTAEPAPKMYERQRTAQSKRKARRFEDDDEDWSHRSPFGVKKQKTRNLPPRRR